jgi:hypothetical protein
MSAARRLAERLLAGLSSPKPARPTARFRVVDISCNIELASSVELADTSAKRSKGLLGRNGLGPGEGLWIVPCESVHTFGMRFAIDLVYLDRQHRIRKIRRNVVPWRLSACLTAHSVIELASGALQEQNVRRGDQIEFLPIEV